MPDYSHKGSVCLMPRLEGLGGPVSFQTRLAEGLKSRGVAVTYDPHDPNCRAILLMGGTRHVMDLWRARQRGVRIVQRLAQVYWIHRRKPSGVGHFLRAERNNLLLAFIRRSLAHRVVYQSQFARQFWQRMYGLTPRMERIIYNSVDLQAFQPHGDETPPLDHIRLLVVEGRLGEANEPYLENSVRFGEALARKMDQPLELMVVGEAPLDLQERWKRKTNLWITWRGVVQREEVPAIDRSAHLLFSAELNAGCPNSVIEALACGLPVVGFATGALPEILQGDSGCMTDYGADHWKLENPDVESLADAASRILADSPRFREGARKRAEQAFDLQDMLDAYLEVLLGD